MHEVLVNRLGGLSLPRKSVVSLTDRPDMTLDDRGRKTTMQHISRLHVDVLQHFYGASIFGAVRNSNIHVEPVRGPYDDFQYS